MKTVSRQSNVEAWSNYNVGRRLFTLMPDYDHYIADLLSQLIRNKEFIVEYGCGDGIWLEYLAKKFPGKQFMGIEWNRRLVDYGELKRLKDFANVTVDCRDATKYAVPCDMYFAFGVVEHFQNATEVMQKWTMKLSPNGFAVITVPNLLNYIYNNRRFNLKFEDMFGKNEVVVDAYGFEQLWSHNAFLKKIMDAGLEILFFRIVEEIDERPMLVIAFKRGEKLG